MRRIVLVSLVARSLAAIVACPAEQTTFTLERRSTRVTGIVFDAEGRPVSGAEVLFGEAAATTGEGGEFAIEDADEGSSPLVVRAEGFAPRVLATRALASDGETEVEIRLEPAARRAEVVFTGDVMFGRRYIDPDADGTRVGALADPHDPASFAALVRHVAPLLREADLVVPNVETAFAWTGVAHPSKPFVFLSPPTSVAGLQALGTDVAALANNHTYDFFDPGLRSTLDALHRAGIETLGAGLDETAAYRPLVAERRGVRIGLSAFCGLRICGVRTGEPELPDEPPYQDAEGSKGGVAKLDEIELGRAVTELRTQADRVVVLLHSGDEYVEAPTPGQQRAARRAIDLGADLVVGHHPHVLQPFESYRGRLVAYSLGNLLFDQDFRETWSGVVLRAELPVSELEPPRYTIDPIWLEDYVPHPATGRLARHVVRHLAEISAPRGVTNLEDGSAGRVLVTPPESLPSSEELVTADAVPDADGRGATLDLEAHLGPRTFVSGVALDRAGAVSLGRDVLKVGSFEHELAGARYDAIGGFNPVRSAQHVVGGDAKDGDRALRICRDYSAPKASGLYSAGRHASAPGRTYSLCGCTRGHAQTLVRAAVAYFGTIERAEEPIASYPVVEGTPSPDWTCSCAETSPPPGARYVSVRLEAEDRSRTNGCGTEPDVGLHCAELDALRLVEWEPWDASRPVPVPNRIDFVRVEAPGPVTVIARTLGEEVPR